jgi:hypothetical protein
MEKEFIPYEQALALKELGFDEPCFGRFYTKPKSKMFGIDERGRHYPIKNTSKKLYTLGEYFVLNDDNVITAPLYQQAFRWFREKYGLWQIVMQNTDKDWTYDIMTIIGMIDYKIFDVFDTYEEAELECLKKLIESVKEK